MLLLLSPIIVNFLRVSLFIYVDLVSVIYVDISVFDSTNKARKSSLYMNEVPCILIISHYAGITSEITFLTVFACSSVPNYVLCFKMYNIDSNHSLINH